MKIYKPKQISAIRDLAWFADEYYYQDDNKLVTAIDADKPQWFKYLANKAINNFIMQNNQLMQHYNEAYKILMSWFIYDWFECDNSPFKGLKYER